MVSFKNKLLICLCIFVTFLPFYLITFTFAADNIYGTQVNNLAFDITNGVFSSRSDRNVVYFNIKSGHTYRFVTNTGSINSAYSSELPAVGVSLDYIGVISDGYEFTVSEDGYLYFSVFGGSFNLEEIYLVDISDIDMPSAVGGLVDNVGISQIWNIFDISINYIVIVVVVAFGLFIIFSLIRKLTKGKEGF